MRKIEIRKPSCIKLQDNDVLIETAGFIPISVKFKQFLENGLVANLRSEQFDTSEVIEKLYSQPDFDINEDDDLFSATEKVESRYAYLQSLRNEEIMRKQRDADFRNKAKPVNNEKVKTNPNVDNVDKLNEDLSK